VHATKAPAVQDHTDGILPQRKVAWAARVVAMAARRRCPQRGQLAVGAVVCAVIVRTRSCWLTALISHAGKDIVDVGHMQAQLRTQG
jgi:hypothetical protein